ncbi:MAG TPA: hypothetical protein VK907_05870, partial [Phnomibacter sp.]|nr:hypothetical protein [Phnomibacter sp.]
MAGTTYYNADTLVFLDGAYVKAAEARIDLYSQTMHYGMGVFEGIRSYADTEGLASIFKAKEHYERLQYSASALNIPLHYTVDELMEATYRVLELNG